MQTAVSHPTTQLYVTDARFTQFDHLPYWSIKPDIKHLVCVSFQRNWSAPLQISWNWSWFQSIPQPSRCNQARIGTPNAYKRGSSSVSVYTAKQSHSGISKLTFFHWLLRPSANITCQLNCKSRRNIMRQTDKSYLHACTKLNRQECGNMHQVYLWQVQEEVIRGPNVGFTGTGLAARFL